MDSTGLTCYTIGWNFVTSSNQYFPCGQSSNSTGAAQSCCYGGDYCMSTEHEYSMCHYTHPVTGGTGYYMAGCTDPTWQDPACPKQCTSQYGADVVFNKAETDWDCCNVTDTSKDCSNPTNFTVDAPAPNELMIQKHLTTSVPTLLLTTAIGGISTASAEIEGSTTTSSSILTTSTSSSVITTSPLPASTAASLQTFSPTPAPASSGLSTGAKAGIAVGCIVAAVLVAGGALLFFMRRRRSKGATKPQELPTVETSQRYKAGSVFSELPFSPSSQGGRSPGGSFGVQSPQSDYGSSVSSDRRPAGAQELEGGMVAKELDAGNERRW